jgi:hypothetical protein
MARVMYCPKCEAIVHDDQARCVMCGNDFADQPPLFEPPSYYRGLAEMRTRQEEVEPSKALGVMAWIAQVFAGVWIFLFCIAPILLIIVAFFAILFIR